MKETSSRARLRHAECSRRRAGHAPCFVVVTLLLTSFTLHAASLTPTKATADAKGEVNLGSLLVAGKSLESPAPSSRPLSHNRALQNALRNLVPATNSTVSARAAILPTIGFDALPSNDGPVPPDTNGAIGPNHAMTALNTQIRVQDKSGVLAGTTASLSQFWAQLSLNDIAFDPRLRYDSLAGRWIFSSLADAGSATSAVLIAVSKTSDPTGDWFIYKYFADPAQKNWADFPSVGFNKDWIVLTVTSVARTAGNKFIAMNYFVFDKADLMNGGAGNVTRFSEPYTAQGRERLACPSVCYDSTLAKVYVVESGAGSTLRVSEVAGTLGAEVVTTDTAAPTSPATYSQVTPSTNLGQQLGATFGIDTNDSIIQNCVFRNGSLWCAQSIFMTSPTRASVQWWQFTPDGTLQQSGLIDDSSAQNMYAFPSIAVNKNNDVLIGYSRFSTAAFISSACSFRLSSDAANTLRPDTLLKAGEAPYVVQPDAYDNRWGDYSTSCVDPANDIDLWTLQQYATAPNGQNDEWSTWWSRVTPVANAISGLIITPDPASVGRAVQFTLGVPLTASVSWDFGDGSTLNSASVSHTYSAAGSYTVSASVTDISGNFSASAPLQVFADTDGNGVPDFIQADADGDSFPDAIELLASTSPTDPSSTPVNNLPAVIASLKAKVSLKFDLLSSSGTIQLTGTLPTPSGFSPAGQTVYVDALGIAAKFSLDSTGSSGATAPPFFKLSTPRNGTAAFKAAILSSLATDKMLLKHQGFDFKNKYKSQPRTLPLNILFNGTVYNAMNQVKLSVTPGKTATAK